MAQDRLADSLTRWVEEKPVWPPVQPVALPPSDDEETPSDFLGDAEGQTFMIEYCDSAGRNSRRRITVWHLRQSENGAIPSLYARCHERNAMRQFRVDRIRCCIDFNGEVHDDVPTYLSETFGMPISVASRRVADEEFERWETIVRQVRHDAALLAAMARCDGLTVPAEVEAILVYLAQSAEEYGDMLSETEIGKLHQYLSRLRPTAKSLTRALEVASSYPPRRIHRLLLAAANVMDADSIRHPAEAKLINDFSRELLGIALI